MWQIMCAPIKQHWVAEAGGSEDQDQFRYTAAAAATVTTQLFTLYVTLS